MVGGIDWSIILGEEHYRVLRKIFMKESYKDLTVNEIVELFNKLQSLGFPCEAETTRGAITILAIEDVSVTIYDSEPDKPTRRGNIAEAQSLLEMFGIKPTI